MYQEELESSSLAKFLNEYDYVFVDTCSLMEDTFPLFMDKLVSSKEYWREELQVIVLGECLDELKKHAKEKSKERASSRLAAARALKIIRHDKWHTHALTITKTLGESFADNAIYTRVSGLRIHNKLLVITQDKTLTTDLLKMNNLDSQKGRYLNVYRINQDSELEKNPGENGPKTSFNKKRDASSFQKEEKDNKKPIQLTKLQKTLIQEDEKLSKNLANQNYKLKLKLRDIDDQLSRLKKAGDQSKNISLHFSKEMLINTKESLISASKKADKKENPVKEDNLPLGQGKLPSEALKRLALNYHTIVRDPSVSYFADIHGELDLTHDDLTAVDVLGAKGNNFTFKKGDKVYVFNKDKEYTVSIAKKEDKPKAKQPKAENKPLPEKKNVQPQNQKKETNVAKKDDDLSKKKIKVVKVKGSVSGGSSSAIPEGIILVVGESRRKSPQSKPIEKNIPLKKTGQKKESTLLKDAIIADKILNANLNNPNYPKEKSLLEISKQKERLKKLSKEETKNFQLKLADLEKFEKLKK